MTGPAHTLLIPLDGRRSRSEGRVAQGGNQPVGPVETVGGDPVGGVAQIFWGPIDVGIEGNEGIEGVGPVRHPLDGPAGLGAVGTQLDDGQLIVPVDSDGTEETSGVLVTGHAVRIVGGPLVVGAQQVFHIFDGDLPLGLTAPRDVVAGGVMVGIGPVPNLVVRIQEALHVPGAGGVVDMVRITV